MATTKFICPDNVSIPIKNCLEKCRMCSRCTAKPLLNILAGNCRERGLSQFTVTELLKPTRVMYFSKMCENARRPSDLIWAGLGSSFHRMNEDCADSNIVTECRIANEIASGQIDAYGDVLENGQMVLVDYKQTKLFKVKKALGIVPKLVPSGEFYKTSNKDKGYKKGDPKMKTIYEFGGRKSRMDWALQLNFYRMLLEESGNRVDKMYIQASIRDFVDNSYGISEPLILIEINRISDRWIKRYFTYKRDALFEALSNGELPKCCCNINPDIDSITKCNKIWGGKMCLTACDGARFCKIGRVMLSLSPIDIENTFETESA